MIEIEIKVIIKIIENRNKINYFVSGIEIFNFYFNVIENITNYNIYVLFVYRYIGYFIFNVICLYIVITYIPIYL